MSTIHILDQGKALCYFLSEGVPKDWPENHRWVGMDECSDANCKVCLDRVKDGRILPGFSQDSILIRPTYGYDQYLDFRGSGHNRLRTKGLCQPYALEVGDVLATGERILSPSRCGFNGTALIHFSSHQHNGIWMGVPSRIALALLPEDAPEEIRNMKD
jgi:hypothetical protein